MFYNFTGNLKELFKIYNNNYPRMVYADPNFFFLFIYLVVL